VPVLLLPPKPSYEGSRKDPRLRMPKQVILPITYQEDDEEDRKDSGLIYAKYYHEDDYNALKKENERLIPLTRNMKEALISAEQNLKNALQYVSHSVERFKK
jgi:hypothetical protein